MGPKNRMWRLSVRTCVVVGLMSAGSVAIAQPAVAGVNCPTGHHCLFESSLTSSRHAFTGSDPDLADNTYSNGHTVDDNSGAASNSSTANQQTVYYEEPGHLGFLFCVNPGSTVASLGPRATDRISSVQVRPRTSIGCL